MVIEEMEEEKKENPERSGKKPVVHVAEYGARLHEGLLTFIR